jgi:putative ABC transport system ATP-binding protein
MSVSQNGPVVVARDVTRRYGEGDTAVDALRGVSVDIAPARATAVMGPSGSGKSTLLNLLAGLDDPDGGAVAVAGEPLSHRPPPAQARVRGRLIGILTQTSGLVEHLDVRGNLRLAASFRPRTPSPADLDGLLDAVRLGDHRSARPSTLSGGETARANLAVALAGGPRLLLADEPTAEVSAAEETMLLRLLRALLPPDGATLLVTHSPAVADAADRVLHLVDGKVSS